MKHINQIDKFPELADKILGKNNIHQIMEIGARDCEETMTFHHKYPKALIYTFECNPETLPVCREKIKDVPEIILTEKAVSRMNGEITFYQIDTEKTRTTVAGGNPGASSLFRATQNYALETYVQKPITVPTITLETFFRERKIEAPDIIWMDIQGAELLALEGAGEYIKKIKLIHLEVEFTEIYQGQPLYRDVVKFFKAKGFSLLTFTNFGKYSGDAVFINNEVENKPLLLPAFIIYAYFFMKEKITGKIRRFWPEKYAS